MPDIERLRQRILSGFGTVEDLKPRKLSIEEWRGMNPELQEWHILTNSENVDAALNSAVAEEEQARRNEINAKAWDAKGFHERSLSRTLSADEKAAATEQARMFSARFPQFVTRKSNSDAIMDWLGERNLPFEFAYIVQAFGDLARGGKLILSPKAIGVGPETEITGNFLKGYGKLEQLMEPVLTEKERTAKAIDSMSADEYAKVIEDKEQVNPWQSLATAQAGKTFQAWHPEFIPSDANKAKMLAAVGRIGIGFTVSALEAAYATVKHELELSSVVEEYRGSRLVDYGPQSTGVPPQVEKASLRKKVRTMSAAELEQACNDDVSFRDSLNSLE